MTRKITTILLALALCLTLLPVGAGAAGTTSGVELKMDGTTLKYGDHDVNTTGDAGLQVTLDPDNSDVGQTTVHGYVLNGGTYTLGADVTIGAPLIIKGTSTNPTTLDLNGHVLKYNGAAKNSVIVVADSAYFVLQDTATNPQTRYATKAADSDVYTLTNDTTQPNNSLSLTGGVITGGTGTKCGDNDFFGGGVFVGSKATFEMTGGNIVGCAVAGMTANGGGVFVAAGKNASESGDTAVHTKFTMTGGSIVGCTGASTATHSYANGGGVFARECAEFTMNNARIANCTATSGGGVYNKGTFTMMGSTIENCTAKSGGGVYVDGDDATFTMTDGTIKSCTATYTGDRNNEFASGGGVRLERGKFNMVGGTIENCKATGNSVKGGGVCVGSSGTFTMTGGTIKSCRVEGTGAKGDGIYMYANGAMKSQGGSVYGVVFVGNSSTFENISAGGGTIFYGSSKFGCEEEGANPLIRGCRVEFKTGDSDTDLYAQTLVGVKKTSNSGSALSSHNENAKISQPEDPSTQENKHVVWSFTKADGSTVGMWDFNKSFAENNPKREDDTVGLSTDNPRTGMKVTLTAVWHDLRKMDAKTATCTETGISTDCWYCDTCNKYFTDSKGENATTIDAVTTETNPNNHVSTPTYQHDKDGHWQVYSCCNTKVNEGEHSFDGSKCSVCGYEKPRRVYRGSGTPTISAVLSHPDAASATNYTSGIYGLTFRSTASFSSFRGVQVDGKTIAASNYIAEEGSIVVYLKAVYLQTLPNGTHTVTILSTEGNATMDFTIGGVQSAKTGDPGVAIYALMALTSYTGTALVVRGRKRK